ncbi:uncharacterized protein LOC127725213 [Mytilus californianus]|uniref:uncharacterized protein LOC127725213 n=1 Tax=Mytilus californianus TaxID=6549 RepID=UPI0022486AFE|nr:uncharacterized protein LOC127725213 [Mytilus californianus]
MRKYDMMTSAAPEQIACGLAIKIDYTIPTNLPETKDTINCTDGTNSRAISLLKNGVLNLRSRIIDGTFTRGYCIQIYRQQLLGDEQSLRISCSQFRTTTRITKHKETMPENVIVSLPVIVAAAIGWCLTVLFAISTIYMYRKRNTPPLNTAIEQHTNPQYEDLRASRTSSCYNEVDLSIIINAERHDHI